MVSTLSSMKRTSGSTSGFQTSSSPPSFRNLLINGDMSIAQRGTTTSSVTSGSTYVVDRFFVAVVNGGTWTMSQDTDVPSGSGFASSIKLDCTTADASLAGADYISMQYRFEGQDLQTLKKGTASAESITLSFWVKSVKTGTFTAQLLDADNSRTISQTYTVDSGSTWEKKTLTFAGDTTGAFNNDNAISMTLLLCLAAGSDWTSGTLSTSWAASVPANWISPSQVNIADSTSNDFWITGLQLEVGSSATDFEHVPYDYQLRRCQRYYAKDSGSVGFGFSSDTTVSAGYNCHVNWPTTMRTSPTIVWTRVGNSASWPSTNPNTHGSTAQAGSAILPTTISAAGAHMFYGSYTADAEL